MNRGLIGALQAFGRGESIHAYNYLGCHRQCRNGVQGYVFRVWAPKAQRVSVVGDFNFWNPDDLVMQPLIGGVWEGFSRYAKEGEAYKYYVRQADGRPVYKADPFAVSYLPLPETSSRILDISQYTWHDGAYLRANGHRRQLNRPVNIYEVHLGSWRRKPDGGVFTYKELAPMLISYVQEMGYTHIELLPITEHPYGPSWGYQVTGYFAPTARYGQPSDLMAFVDACHQAGIGVILDWVPSHFPKDEYGLYEFDGTFQYELSDPVMNEHPDWTTRIFDYGKPEVQSCLISSAVFWLEKYHFDGLRVDAVASMLYLDYNRKAYTPNEFGGRENLHAIAFLKKLNRAAFSVKKSVLMIAEESSAFPKVTKPDYDGGLGFLMKWNMGWMNDMLSYLQLDPLYRKQRHHSLTFSMTYAFSENFVLPLSHDEVVHGKKSMIEKMPGSYDEKFSALRMFYAYQMAQPGKKLNFMGNEFAQFIEWNDHQQLDWCLLAYERHRQMQQFVKTLNQLYLQTAALWQTDDSWAGFQWMNPDDADHNAISFVRWSKKAEGVLVLCNFCPVCWQQYRVAVPRPGQYRLLLSSDAAEFGGGGLALLQVQSEEAYGQEQWVTLTLPPNSTLYYTVPKLQRVLLHREKENACEISEEALCGDAVGRRTGEPADGPDAKYGEAGCALRGEIPHH